MKHRKTKTTKPSNTHSDSIVHSDSLQNTKESTNSSLGPQQQGQVITCYGKNSDVEDENGNVYQCLTRRNVEKLVCGDKVLWRSTGENSGIVEQLIPRASLLSRPDFYKQLKPIASNITQIIVVFALKPPFSEDLINRYLVAAELTKIRPILVLNKIDLLSQQELEQTQKQLQIYQDIGYKVITASTKISHGTDKLSALLEQESSIFVGQSGVGKSSLINTLLPDAELRVGALSQSSGLGKHTTTVSVLFPLKKSGNIIDSPGIREFGLGHVSQQRIADGFIEFDTFLGSCKFNDCSHHHEPACAITTAVKNGQIKSERYESYRRIVLSLSRR